MPHKFLHLLWARKLLSAKQVLVFFWVLLGRQGETVKIHFFSSEHSWCNVINQSEPGAVSHSGELPSSIWYPTPAFCTVHLEPTHLMLVLGWSNLQPIGLWCSHQACLPPQSTDPKNQSPHDIPVLSSVPSVSSKLRDGTPIGNSNPFWKTYFIFTKAPNGKSGVHARDHVSGVPGLSGF